KDDEPDEGDRDREEKPDLGLEHVGDVKPMHRPREDEKRKHRDEDEDRRGGLSQASRSPIERQPWLGHLDVIARASVRLRQQLGGETLSDLRTKYRQTLPAARFKRRTTWPSPPSSALDCSQDVADGVEALQLGAFAEHRLIQDLRHF